MDRMKDFLIDNFEDRELKFKFEHDSFDEKNKIAPDIRQNMYLIFKEAVTNAVKHSNGNLVSVELRQSKGTLILNVHDNGVVDQTSIKSSGLGLSNMKMRAERINAEINQTWDSGCRIGLRVPL
jgi:signal transduction histidine kinase